MTFPYAHGYTRDVIRAAYEMDQELITQQKPSYDVILAVEETFREVHDDLLAIFKNKGKNE